MLQIIRTLLWMVLLSLSESVIRGEDVTGVVGGNVLLPCSFTGPVPPNVYWRIDYDVVFDIKNGTPSVPSDQHERFKGRVSSKEEWNKEGNFSIRLENLTKNDNGTYKCTEPNTTPVEVRLEVSDKSTSKGEEPAPGGASTTGGQSAARGESAVGGAVLLHVLLLSAVGLLSPSCCC